MLENDKDLIELKKLQKKISPKKDLKELKKTFMEDS
jgi:hypothetical protein